MHLSEDYESWSFESMDLTSAILVRKSEVCSYWDFRSSAASHGPLLHTIKLNKTESVVFISLVLAFSKGLFLLSTVVNTLMEDRDVLSLLTTL